MSGGAESPQNGLHTTFHSETEPAQGATTDPFNTLFDDENEEEWWNNEESPTPTQEDTAAASRMTQWPTLAKRVVGPTSKSTQRSIRKRTKRYSVYKPTREKSRQRQKKQNAAAGIRVVTNFSRHHGPPPVVQQPSILPEAPPSVPKAGCFVDLAALQALDSEAPNAPVGFWKSIKGIIPSKTGSLDARDRLEGETSHSPIVPGETAAAPPERISSRRGRGLIPTPLKLDLSPGDRPIVIGISVPSTRLADHITSPETASSETSKVLQNSEALRPNNGVPETPTIIITPTQNPPTWFSSGHGNKDSQARTRAASNAYSRSSNYSPVGHAPSDVLPMPQIPVCALRSTQEREQANRGSVRYSVSTIFSEDEEVDCATESRVVSSYTVFEEDESPILARKVRALSVSQGSIPTKHTSSGTVMDQRRSKGWWNYIITPFLSRSNTVVSPRSATQERPALPSLETAATKARDARKWEKSFSPMTPATSTTISSDIWCDKRNTVVDTSKDVESREAISSPDEEAGTLPFMLVGGDLGTATIPERGNHPAHLDGNVNGDNLRRDHSTRSLSSSDRDASFMLGGSIINCSANLTRNPLPQPCAEDIDRSPVAQEPQATNMIAQTIVANTTRVITGSRDSLPEGPQPPPYSPPRANFPRYHAIFPPGRRNNLREPPSPSPLTPGLQQAMSSRGGIALSEVPLTPAPRRPINLNSGYPGLPVRQVGLPITAADLGQPSKKARKAEAKRQRYEREDALAHNVGGLWRGRGCVPNRGCYGRGGAEGRKRRRWWFGLTAGFLSMIILIVALATTLHRNSNAVIEQSQWLNLTGFPPIFTGLSTVASPDNPIANTGCVKPATMWSCFLPKELQQSVAQPNRPNFRIQIQWDNSSSANATFANITDSHNLPTRGLGNNAVSAGQLARGLMLKARQAMVFTPSPPTPSYAEQYFLGNTTDGIVSANKAGEPTPFYISFLSTTTTAQLVTRDNSISLFPNATAEIVSVYPPDQNADGTAAPANLLPFPVQQPLRLYDRGLESEHYGFYTYFNRSIFLKPELPLSNSNVDNEEVPDDSNGGSTETEAQWRCTWAQTRFLVQMWTRKNSTASLLNGTSISISTSSANYTANDFTSPGSFPYPITITTDRHGGDPALKLLYCYRLDDREHPITSSALLMGELKGFGGVAINPGPGLFSNASDYSLGGFDGGTGGCSCQWRNWEVANT